MQRRFVANTELSVVSYNVLNVVIKQCSSVDRKNSSALPYYVYIGGLCCNVTPSDHAHILHTGVFEGEEFNKKGSRCGSPPVQKLLTISIVNDLI